MTSVSIDSTLILLFATASVASVLAAYSLRSARIGRISNSRLDALPGTPLLGRFPIEAFYWVAGAAGRGLSRTGVSPDALSLVSLVLTAFTLPLVATGRFEAAGAVLFLGSAFDMLDGIVARERGMASHAGEMLDSVLDRYADAFCLLGLALFYHESSWRLGIVLLALIGSTMVSYVRAKAEKFALTLPTTTMRRAERVVYLAAGFVFGPALSSWIAPSDPTRPVTLAVVGLVAAVSNVAALRLLLAARAELQRQAAP